MQQLKRLGQIFHKGRAAAGMQREIARMISALCPVCRLVLAKKGHDTTGDELCPTCREIILKHTGAVARLAGGPERLRDVVDEAKRRGKD